MPEFRTLRPIIFIVLRDETLIPHLDLDSIVWEPGKVAVPRAQERQDSMLATLQAWATPYYQRDDQWSYTAHRRIFEAFGGSKIEYSDPSAFSAQQSLERIADE